jgi:hypothetical protein
LGIVEDSAAVFYEKLTSFNGLEVDEVSVSIIGDIEVIEVSVILLLRDKYDSSRLPDDSTLM